MPYVIRIIRQFTGPRTTRTYATDNESGERFVTGSRRYAEHTAQILAAGRYDLLHGETSRPEYKVVRVPRGAMGQAHDAVRGL